MLNLIAGCSVADNGQCAVIEDEPLMIDLDCHDSTIFVWQPFLNTTIFTASFGSPAASSAAY
jgi:hypothetical protein